MAWFDQAEPEVFHEPTPTPEETGFWENMNAAYGAAKREDLPIFSPAQSNQTLEVRKNIINKHVTEGRITPEELDFFDSNSGYDIDGLSHYMHFEKGLTDVMTRSQYEEARNQEYADYRAKEAEVFSNQSKLGTVGEFVGGAGAMLNDPVYVGGAMLGYGVAAAYLEASVAVNAAASGLVEMGIETAATPTKMSFKQELGLDYGASEAVVNILAAGVFGTVIGGASKWVENRFLPTNPSELTVAQALERIESFVEGVSYGTPKELAPIINTLRQSDPEESALKVLQADEAKSIRMNERGANRGADPRTDADSHIVKEAEAEYNAYLERSKPTEEGVPYGTHAEPEHKLVVEQYARVAKIDENLKAIEEVC